MENYRTCLHLQSNNLKKGEENMREKFGEILGVIFEHKGLYHLTNVGLVLIMIGLQICSSHIYSKQLEVIVPSIYQAEMWCLDFWTIMVGIGIWKLFCIRHDYLH